MWLAVDEYGYKCFINKPIREYNPWIKKTVWKDTLAEPLLALVNREGIDYLASMWDIPKSIDDEPFELFCTFSIESDD